MTKMDLSKFKKPTTNYLKEKPAGEISAENELSVKKTSAIKKEKTKKSEKIGRPIIGEEPLSIPVTVNFTQTEIEKLKKSAGIAALSTYVRHIVKKSGVIGL